MSETVRSKDGLKSKAKVWTDSHSLQQGESLFSLTLANTRAQHLFFHLYQLDKWKKQTNKPCLFACFQGFQTFSWFFFRGASRMALDPMIPHVLPFL